MKKFIVFLLFVFLTPVQASQTTMFDIVLNEHQVVYSPDSQTWGRETLSDNSIVLTKKSAGGYGAYSQFFYSNGDLALTLTTDTEILYKNKLISIKNNTLSFCQIIYDGENFVEIPITLSEIYELFPNFEIIRMSLFDEDGKIWIHKPFLKKKQFLLVNDTNNYYNGVICKSKLEQDSQIKGLINIHRYGIFTFTHFGKRDGEFKIYVR